MNVALVKKHVFEGHTFRSGVLLVEPGFVSWFPSTLTSPLKRSTFRVLGRRVERSSKFLGKKYFADGSSASCYVPPEQPHNWIEIGW